MTRKRPPTAAAAGQVSDAIRLARLICISGMVYVHAWTGLDAAALAQAAGTAQGMLRWGLVEIFGRSAVPLLGMIAGWLAAGSANRRPYGLFLAGKARTLLAPMVLWNVMAITLVSGAALLGLVRAPIPTSWWWTLDELFCLASPNDINVQTPFLRDLFVCMALAPLLARLPPRRLALAAAAALVWTICGVASPILLRPEILVFSIFGLAARRLDWAPRVGGAPLIAVATPYIALTALRFWLEISGVERQFPGPAAAGLDVLMRLASAAAFWAFAWRLASKAAAKPLLRLEGYAFLMFCDHLIFTWLGGPLVGLVTGPLGSPLYPAFLILQPVLILWATVGLGKALVRFAPQVGRLLSGGRLGGANASHSAPVQRPALAIPAGSGGDR